MVEVINASLVYYLPPHRFIALEDLNESRPEKVQALISSEIVYILGDEHGRKEIMNAFNFAEMFCCRCIPDSQYTVIRKCFCYDSVCLGQCLTMSLND